MTAHPSGESPRREGGGGQESGALGDGRPTRADLIAICERAFTPQEKWRDRDSSAAHRQLGECYALLKAGCDFWATYDPKLDTWWVTVEFHGFDWFEYGESEGCTSNERYYLPTAERLDRNPGEDWY